MAARCGGQAGKGARCGGQAGKGARRGGLARSGADLGAIGDEEFTTGLGGRVEAHEGAIHGRLLEGAAGDGSSMSGGRMLSARRHLGHEIYPEGFIHLSL